MTKLEHQKIRIADQGREYGISFDEVLDFHHGNARWGCAVAFRALQRAEPLLSVDSLWDRSMLTIRSAHPGPGVRDAIERVTRCVSNQRFTLTDPQTGTECTSGLRYEWEISDDRNTIMLRLRDGFVPDEFFALLDNTRLGADSQRYRDRLGEIKRALIEKIWREPLTESFPASPSIPRHPR